MSTLKREPDAARKVYANDRVRTRIAGIKANRKIDQQERIESTGPAELDGSPKSEKEE
jgi:hypothetical protein